MASGEATIKWLLKFIDMDFSQFREGDWLNLADDFLPFLGLLPTAKKLSQNTEALCELQKSIKESLVGVASVPAEKAWIEGDEWEKAYPDFIIPGEDISSLTFLFYKRKKWRVEAGTKDFTMQGLLTVALALVSLHESGKLERLRYCEAPSIEEGKRHCGNLFFAEHGRKQFCSAKCKGRDSTRRFQARHKEELRMKAHARYEKKKTAVHAPPKKVSEIRKAKIASQ